MLLLDTSGLLAALDSDQRFHRVAREALGRASGPLILSPFVLAELDYLLLTRVGGEAELALLGGVARGTYRLEPFSAFDVAEARVVIERYGGFRRRRPCRRFQRGARQAPRCPRHPHARRAALSRAARTT